MTVQGDLLRLLGKMPFLDRLEAAAVSGWSRGAVYASCAALEEAGLIAPLPHASELLAPTRRYHLTQAGLRRLAELEETGLGELLRSRPLTAHWRRLLQERLDGVASTYRLAAAITEAAWPLRFRWYRAAPMDAAIALPDGRTLFVVRQGETADRTAFAKRLWRLREGARPGAYLLLVPDAVRLRHTARLMAAASSPAFLALERDAVAGDTGVRVWRTASGSPWLSLAEVLPHVTAHRAWPGEEPLARATVPRDVQPRGLCETPAPMLPSALGASRKRVLGLMSDWPWIAPADLGPLLGVSDRRVSQALRPLREASLVARVGGRLVLSDRGLALLARREPLRRQPRPQALERPAPRPGRAAHLAQRHRQAQPPAPAHHRPHGRRPRLRGGAGRAGALRGVGDRAARPAALRVPLFPPPRPPALGPPRRLRPPAPRAGAVGVLPRVGAPRRQALDDGGPPRPLPALLRLAAPHRRPRAPP